MKEFSLVLLGFILSFIPQWLDRKRTIKTHWSAINAEIKLVKQRTKTFIEDDIKSPLYRLPVSTYRTSYTMLLTQGQISGSEVVCLENFYSLAEDFNRGLELASRCLESGDTEKLSKFHNRNIIKATRLIIGDKNCEAYCHEVESLINSKITTKSWRY